MKQFKRALAAVFDAVGEAWRQADEDYRHRLDAIHDSGWEAGVRAGVGFIEDLPEDAPEVDAVVHELRRLGQEIGELERQES